MRLLLERPDLVAVDKPPGVTVIPGRAGPDGTSLRELLELQLKRPVWVVHRIDRDTSGVVVFALDAATHRTLSMAFEAGQVKKQYVALVKGSIAAPMDLTTPLVPARKSRMRPARAGEVGKDARTLVRPIEQLRDATLVEVEPLTGRTHQIRVHLAHAGHPLLFDHQYGESAPIAGLTRTPLHAARLELMSPQLSASAPLPTDMQGALAQLR